MIGSVAEGRLAIVERRQVVDARVVHPDNAAKND